MKLTAFVTIAALSLAPVYSRRGIERDIAYMPGGAAHTLDLTTPDNTSNYPTVLFVHGGSLTSGDKADAPYGAICANFAAHGIACASTNYTLLNSGRWPQPARDVAGAFAYLYGSIARRGGDPSRIYVLGHSSGCQLAANIGTDERYLQDYKLKPRDIKGVIALGCLLDNTVDPTSAVPRVISHYTQVFGSIEATNDAAPFMHVGPHNAPTLIMLADAERENPPILASANRFAALSRAAGLAVPVEVLADRKHMTAMAGLADAVDPAFKRVLHFIETGQ